MITGKKRLSLKESQTAEGMDYIASILKNRGLAIFPSDTTYACVVDATYSEAVDKLISFKKRPTGKAISVFIPSIDEAQKYTDCKAPQLKMLKALLPGPYTVILPSRHILSHKLEAENGTLGIRVPQNEWIRVFLQYYKNPLTATSANIAGQSPHYSIDALLNSLSEKKKKMIDVIVDAGVLPNNKPSTVIDISHGDLKIVRQGDAKVGESYNSHSPQETQKIARAIFNKYKEKLQKKPLVILLYGDLGTGKTEFTKGIGNMLGTMSVISPTFVIYYEYKVEHPNVNTFYHFDLYRLKDSDELDHLGLNEILVPKNLICIEWSEKSEPIMNLLNEKAVVIKVHITDDGDESRSFSIEECSS